MGFDIDKFIHEARYAAAQARAEDALATLMRRTLRSPEALAEATPDFDGVELPIVDDEAVSAFWLKFYAGIWVAPHEHRIAACVGVYQGIEVNRLYRRDDHGLVQTSEHRVGVGQTLSIPADGIHSVYPGGGKESRAIHVYLGRLTKTGRSMFHPETGAEMPLTPSALEALNRTAPE